MAAEEIPVSAYASKLLNVPGKSIKGVLVEYGPGVVSSAHTHPKSAFIYAIVLEGAIRSQVNDGPVTVYCAEESFSELPGDHHAVSENVSKTEPAKLLGVFVVAADEKNLLMPYGKWDDARVHGNPDREFRISICATAKKKKSPDGSALDSADQDQRY